MIAFTKHLIQTLVLSCIVIFKILPTSMATSTLTKNDPFPVYTTVDPHAFLMTQCREKKDVCRGCYLGTDAWAISFSPFWQKATRGKTFSRGIFDPGNAEGEHNWVPLGDLNGPWNMLGLLYGERPQLNPEAPEGRQGQDIGQNFTPNNTPTLYAAQQKIFPIEYSNEADAPFALVPTALEVFDPKMRVGFFSVPLKYRKIGMRFELSIRPFDDFGFTLQTGVADLKQTLTDFVDRAACKPVDDCPQIPEQQQEDIRTHLMYIIKATEIFDEIKLDVNNFHETGLEDTRFYGWWRHVFPIRQCGWDWADVNIIPFVVGGGSAPTGKKANLRKAFALPLGNNGHWSAGFCAGVDIDFLETIALCFEVGFTHFFERTVYNLRIPTHPRKIDERPRRYSKQIGVFPFFVPEAKIQPGRNANFGAGFHAFRFIDRLSVYFEYVLVNHLRDEIKNKKQIATYVSPVVEPTNGQPPAIPTPPPAFIPEEYEKLTDFSTQVINVGLNYEISPEITLGVLVQCPVAQRNSYRSTTFMGTLRAAF